jgi:hypothetical protein
MGDYFRKRKSVVPGSRVCAKAAAEISDHPQEKYKNDSKIGWVVTTYNSSKFP